MAEWADTGDIETYEDAVQVVLEGINMRVDPRRVLWCNYPALSVEGNELLDKIKKDTKKLEKEITDDLCLSRLWYVGTPRFKLARRGIAHLSCEIDLYYVACDVTDDDCHWCWFGKVIPKADAFDIPLCLVSPLIDALQKGEAEVKDAHIVERAPGYAMYDFMGREWKIPDAFLGFVWALVEKGKGFEGLLDSVSCRLMDKFSKELPSPETPKLVSGDDYQALVTCLKENMGYPKAKAEEATAYVMGKFPDERLETKITEALKYLGNK